MLPRISAIQGAGGTHSGLMLDGGPKIDATEQSRGLANEVLKGFGKTCQIYNAQGQGDSVFVLPPVC
jgi:hypothetical protein